MRSIKVANQEMRMPRREISALNGCGCCMPRYSTPFMVSRGCKHGLMGLVTWLVSYCCFDIETDVGMAPDHMTQLRSDQT